MKFDSKILVTTYPFGVSDSTPLDILYNNFRFVQLNKLKRKYSAQETKDILKENNPDIILAGNEKYTPEILDLIPNLKMISKVGVGVDNIDLNDCQKRNIVVTNTPNAPTNAVAELVICQMINMLRNMKYISDIVSWRRYIGKELKYCKIGIIGVGRIGTRVVQKLKGFDLQNDIYVNDIVPERMFLDGCVPKIKNEILQECDVITIHIPMNDTNYNYITKKELLMMKPDAKLINMSRGGIVNEKDLFEHAKDNLNFSAAVDVFEKEPYVGNLLNMENIYLTPHLASCTVKSRFDMEVGAVNEVINYIQDQSFLSRIV